MFAEGGHEVFDVFFAFVFDAKIVNDEGEGDVARFMAEEAIGVRLVVAVGGKAFAEVVVGDLSCLFEAVPCFGDAGVDVSVVG